MAAAAELRERSARYRRVVPCPRGMVGAATGDGAEAGGAWGVAEGDSVGKSAPCLRGDQVTSKQIATGGRRQPLFARKVQAIELVSSARAPKTPDLIFGIAR